jgi:hypothetical protein
MRTIGLRDLFDQTGFVLVPQVVPLATVRRVRQVLNDRYDQLERGATGRDYLLPSEILEMQDVWRVTLVEPIVRTLSEILEPGYTMIPDLTAGRNSFGVPKTLHRDCDSEGAQAYLNAPDYRFVKCGVYLQDNTAEWGGGITLVPGGHKLPFHLPGVRLSSKVKTVYNRLGIRFNERWVETKAGDFLAFDSRLPHQSAFPSRFRPADLVRSSLPLPEDRTKFVLYWDACAAACAQDFLRNTARRAREEMLYCDYLRLAYPSDFPPDFVEATSQAGVRVASYEGADHQEWHRYYATRFHGSPPHRTHAGLGREVSSI